jgi:ATP-binding cassette subfamily B protein
LAVVPQEITLFHRTILENIRFARPDATEDEVIAAARAAHCDGFIRRFAQGYDTVVGERGTRLSGGQRQRIGIARAFLKDAPIIILDEATSALDTESEMEIQRALVEQMRDRTVIAVAHRLSTLIVFDRVIVLNGGRIVEDGTLLELRRRGGLFDRMWRLQADQVRFPQDSKDAAAEEAA